MSRTSPSRTREERIDRLRVAIVHYWLLSDSYGGGEKVVEALAEMFPEADIFAVVADEATRARFSPHRVTTSFLQRIPGSHRYHRHFLPLYPFALEQFDLRDYDFVLSSESGPAKGVITSAHTCHICYCHSPMRYLWDLYHPYMDGADVRGVSRAVFAAAAHYLRLWDVASASRVDHFVANSRNVAARIRKHYRREAAVIYPPVDIAAGCISHHIDDYYLVVSRLVDYKRVDLAIDACQKLGRRLRIVGDGPQFATLKRRSGKWIEFLGHLRDDELRDQYAHCRALLLTAEEDFGITSVEAQSFGRPVIAFGRGGALESVAGPFAGDEVVPGSSSGIFFGEQSRQSLCDALIAFDCAEADFSPASIAAGAGRFSVPRFKREMQEFIARCLNSRDTVAALPRTLNSATRHPVGVSVS
jgi:glycosyltransferase involved in cell wall biosynthesis